jgi:hypothetical protein
MAEFLLKGKLNFTKSQHSILNINTKSGKIYTITLTNYSNLATFSKIFATQIGLFKAYRLFSILNPMCRSHPTQQKK